jgi:phytoene desaturase
VHAVAGMSGPNLVIVGGGLAGLSAGCYARASGYRTTIIEHNLALGGVCTAWRRGPYVVDGCIHWLTGGPFARLYEELGILPGLGLRTLDEWVTWRDAHGGDVVRVTRDLEQLGRDLCAMAPEDAEEIERLVAEAGRFVLEPPVDRPPEIASLREQLQAFWEMRGQLGTIVHFRKPLGEWARGHLKCETLRRFVLSLLPEEAPAMMLLFVLGYLKRGWLSRPVGGTAAFRDALVGSYERLGGRSVLHATVDEVLVRDGRACGVRLDDGSMIAADAVICTSSTPETVLRLLGGRYDRDATRDKMERWKMFQPIVLASFGVEAPLRDVPAMLLIDGLPAFAIGGFRNDRLYVRVCNDDPSFAPAGHAVVQTLLATDYSWWATRGADYEIAKEEVARIALEQLEHAIPGIRPLVRMTDVATPITYWRQTRSWRGAYEGWIPNESSLFGHVRKKLAGLSGFYMAGQWVEPGGGVPTAVMSGRQAVQILCDDDRCAFQTPLREDQPPRVAASSPSAPARV